MPHTNHKPQINKKTIPITHITIDTKIQQRIKIHHETVENYVIKMKKGSKFSPLILFHDGSNDYLADGFHRYRVITVRSNGIKDGITNGAGLDL